MMKSPLVLPLLALLVFVLAGVYVAAHIEEAIDTDILSLLPGDAHDRVLADALHQAGTAASDRIVIAITGSTAEKRKAAADELAQALKATGIFQSSSEEGEALWKWLFAHRTQMLCEKDREALQNNKGAEIVREATRAWYSPFALGSSALMQSDPLLLTNRLLDCAVPKSMLPRVQDKAEIISGRIEASVYRIDVQDQFRLLLEKWRDDPAHEDMMLSRAGTLFHAAYGASQARNEMTMIGGVTTLAILLFYWMMFRSLRAPVLAVFMVIYCLIIGLAFTLLCFGRIHVMSLVFGAALIGMVVDYTTYYLVTGLENDGRTMSERKRHIFKPLSLGMLTSVGAFAALLFFPVIAFQQIAVLGGVGLIAAYVATFVLTPLAVQNQLVPGPGAIAIEKTAGAYLAKTYSPLTASGIIVVCLFVATIGISSVHLLDDVRQFQAPSPILMAEESEIRALTGFATSGNFLLIRGETEAAATETEADLLASLRNKGLHSSITIAASDIVPTASQMASDRQLTSAKLLQPFLTPFLESFGLGNATPYDIASAQPVQPPEMLDALRGKTGNTYWSIVPVTGDLSAIPEVTQPNVMLVEPATRYTELMLRYRHLAVYGLVASVVATGLLLVMSYGNVSSLLIMLPMVLSLVVTPVLTGLLGIPFSFFSAMGLFLVVGAGVDYAIFQWEHPEAAGKWTRVGIVLAALMTCISVGLLGLSSVLPVRSFGVTVAIGILLSLMLSPLVRVWTTSHAK